VAIVESVTAEDSEFRRPSPYVPAGSDPAVFCDPDGELTLRLRPYWNGAENLLRVFDTQTGLMLKPTDRRLFKLGILSVQVRGEKYYHRACKSGDFSPGQPLILRPEPDNAHDAHAIAVVEGSGKYRCGYLNKQKARAFPKFVEAAGSVEAISVRGTEAGQKCDQVGVIAGSPATMKLLLSGWTGEATPSQEYQSG